MTGTLPHEIQEVFDRFLTAEFTTVDSRGQPITWPVTPYYRPGDECIDITTGLGYPKKADDAARNPMVSLLFSDPTGSEIGGGAMVLVQGTAKVIRKGPLFLDVRDRLYKKFKVYKSNAGFDEGEAAIIEVTPRKRFSWWFK